MSYKMRVKLNSSDMSHNDRAAGSMPYLICRNMSYTFHNDITEEGDLWSSKMGEQISKRCNQKQHGGVRPFQLASRN